jgi:excinuclease ABC subunit A
MGAVSQISLRGVEVNNLQGIDLDIPHRKLVVLCGVSGSGKSSLALDTLYAEGQRRYIESFSAYTRQFLQRLERPDADRIDGIPPAIAVTSKNATRSSRSTVGTTTETSDYLRLLFAKIGRVICRQCGREVRRDTAQSASEALKALAPGTRYMIAFPVALAAEDDPSRLAAAFQEDGFVRAIVGGRVVNLAEAPADVFASISPGANGLYVVVDRLAADANNEARLRDSLETALTKGRGRCFAFVEESRQDAAGGRPQAPLSHSMGEGQGVRGIGTAGQSDVPSLPAPLPQAGEGRSAPNGLIIDGRSWRRMGFSTQLACEDCGLEYPVPEPRLYSFNSPLGACPQCEGFGNVIDIDMELVVPDPQKSIRDGAIAPGTARPTPTS